MLGGKSHRITEWYTPFQTSEVAVNEAKMKHRKESKQMANLLLHDDRRFGLVFLASAAVIHQKWELPQKMARLDLRWFCLFILRPLPGRAYGQCSGFKEMLVPSLPVLIVTNIIGC
jgi:hypothetical protein